MGKLGRPAIFDDLKAKRICDAVRDGSTRRCAAGLAGVSYTQLKFWLKLGREGDTRYAAFAARLELADSEAEHRMVLAMQSAAVSGAPGTWKAAESWLERRRRLTWRRPITPKAEDDPHDDLSGKSEEELVAAVEKWMAERKAKVG